MGCDDHVDAYGTGQLCNTCNRQLYLLACRHNQVTELIDDDDDIWHVLMSVLRIQLAVNELLVILLDIARLGHLQQVVAGIHLLAQRVQRAHHLGDVCDDGIRLLVWYLGQEVLLNSGIDAELHLLRVYQHYLQFCRMLLVEE